MKKLFSLLVALMLCMNVMTAFAENETIQVIMSTGTTQAFTETAAAKTTSTPFCRPA